MLGRRRWFAATSNLRRSHNNSSVCHVYLTGRTRQVVTVFLLVLYVSSLLAARVQRKRDCTIRLRYAYLIRAWDHRTIADVVNPLARK